MADLTNEEIKGLLAGAHDAPPWRDPGADGDGIIWPVSGPGFNPVGASIFPGNARLMAAAPDLARAALDARRERDEARSEVERLRAEREDVRQLAAWLAETILVQQDSFSNGDCPQAVADYMMMKVPRVQGLMLNIGLSDLAAMVDRERRATTVLRGLVALGARGPKATP